MPVICVTLAVLNEVLSLNAQESPHDSTLLPSTSTPQ